jgi:hypothetical protein
MAYSIYYYIKDEAMRSPDEALKASPLYHRVHELLFGGELNTEEIDIGFGWFKPRDFEGVDLIVEWLVEAKPYIHEIYADNWQSEPHPYFLKVAKEKGLEVICN